MQLRNDFALWKKRFFYFLWFYFLILCDFLFISSVFYVLMILRYRIYCKKQIHCKKTLWKFKKIAFLKSKKSYAFLHGWVSQKNHISHAIFTMQKPSKLCKNNIFDPHPIQKLYSLIYSKLFRVSKVMRYTASAFFLRNGGSFLYVFYHVLKNR